MEFNTRKYNDITIITLKGKLIGMPETQELLKLLASYFEKDIKKIVIDLKNVDWIGSVGIGAIVSCVLEAHSAEVDLRFAGLNEKVKRVIEIAKMDRALQIYSSVDKALQGF